MQVAQRLVLFLRRAGNQAQFSAALQRQTNEPGPLAQFTSFVLEHIDEDLRVPELARCLGMSPRTLSRWCRTELGESPAEAVRRLRVEEAARQLSSTSLPLKTVAATSGLGDPSTLWRLFVSQYGVTPDEYRARFSSTIQQRSERVAGRGERIQHTRVSRSPRFARVVAPSHTPSTPSRT
jgi:transcriptional regulator GlxA family with amidase domain